jgi:hypothetical protein
MLAFGLFLFEYGPMLLGPRQERTLKFRRRVNAVIDRAVRALDRKIVSSLRWRELRQMEEG